GPMNASSLCMAFAFPCGDLGGPLVLVLPPAMQALAIHHATFRLRHVQPTAVFGRVMTLALVQEASRLLWRKRFIQARAIIRVQIVLDQTHFLRLRIIRVQQFSHTTSVILADAPCRDWPMPPATQGLTHPTLRAHALPFILVVYP